MFVAHDAVDERTGHDRGGAAVETFDGFFRGRARVHAHAYEQLSEFEARASFGAWLTRIAVREALTRSRRSRLAGDAAAGYVAKRAGTTVDEPPDLASSRELAAALEVAVDALPPGQRAVFVLRTVEGLDLRECADSLGVTEGVVKIRLHRARHALRRSLERDLADAGTLRAFHRFDGERCDRIVAGVLSGSLRSRLRSQGPPREAGGCT